MRFTKVLFFSAILLGLLLSNRLYSQTFVIPHVGVSLHNVILEEFTGNIVHSYEGLNNNLDCDLRIDFKHYLTSKWFISVNSNIHLKSHTYSIHTLGINPRVDYSYRLFGYGLKSGIAITNKLELGLGFSRMHLYDQRVTSFMVEQNAGSSSLYCSAFFMSYRWDRLITSITYNKSINDSSKPATDVFSIHFGYLLNLLDPIQKRSRVNCPKL